MSMLISTKRILKTGFVSFWRNGVVSIITVLIMVATLFVIGSLVFAKSLADSALTELENKVDITVYFKKDAKEGNIMSLKNNLLNLSEVKEVEYISREEALAEFKERHANNNLIIQSIEELDDNPLGANINIKAKETSQYESIAKFLSASAAGSTSIIDKVNYQQNKLVISRLSKIIESSRKLGLGATIILIFISVFVVFNTIRLAIYIAREEISVMRLVGAKNMFVRGPFLVEGAIYGVFASIITMALFYPFLTWVGPITEESFFGINLLSYYLTNFFEVFAILLIIGVFVGTFSSWIAVRKYLKV